MSGIVFDRLRQGPVQDEWDGQFAIATLPGDGAEVTYLATYPPPPTAPRSGSLSRKMAACPTRLSRCLERRRICRRIRRALHARAA
jgi:hypothetical protein